MHPRIQSELAAVESYTRALKAMDECARIYLEQGLEIPSLLREAMGTNQRAQQASKKGVEHEFSEDEEKEPGTAVRAPEMPDTPEGLPSNWIHIRMDRALPSSLALAYIASETEPVSPNEVVLFVRQISNGTAVNSIYNALKRLTDNGVLRMTDGRYEVARREEAGILSGQYLWGNPQYLFSQEVGRYRREALIHAIDELEPASARKLLLSMTASPWIKVPITTDAVKQDLKYLEERGIVRKPAGSRSWEMVPEEEQPLRADF